MELVEAWRMLEAAARDLVRAIAEMEGVELPADEIEVAGAVAARVAAFLLTGFVKLSRRVPPSEALDQATAMTLSQWALERLLLSELACLNTAG